MPHKMYAGVWILKEGVYETIITQSKPKNTAGFNLHDNADLMYPMKWSEIKCV